MGEFGIPPLDHQSQIVFLTGAGISAQAVQKAVKPPCCHGTEEVTGVMGRRIKRAGKGTPFEENPSSVDRVRQEFLKQSVENPLNLGNTPNEAHRSLLELQKHYPHHVTILNQNVDGLSGEGVINLFENVRHVSCKETKGFISLPFPPISTSNFCGISSQSSSKNRPQITLSKEKIDPQIFKRSTEKTFNSKCFIVIGDKLSSDMSRFLLQLAKAQNAYTILISKTKIKPDLECQFDEVHVGSTVELVPKLCLELSKQLTKPTNTAKPTT